MRQLSPYDEILNRKVTPEEFERLAARTDEERAEDIALIDWFMTRYPTAEARLAYARRAYREWTKGQTR